MTLRYDEVADLIRIVDASACEELVLETAELKLVIRRRGAGRSGEPSAPSGDLARPGPAPSAPTVAPPAPRPSSAPPTTAKGQEVRAPMVGTFYRAPSPEAAPFVEVGTSVSVGQPLCVIEVMKLFTTIFAETAGRVAEIGAANAELVEYGQVLFVIEET